MWKYFQYIVILIGIVKASSIEAFSQSDSTHSVYIDSIFVTGNHKTRDFIVLRELAIQPGDSIKISSLPYILEVDRRKVVNTNLFIDVALKSHFSVDSTRLSLEVVVKERWYLIALPVFELADRNFNEWWYDRGRDMSRVTYGAYMSYGNLTGRADRLKALVELGFTPKYEMSYAIPYIDKKRRIGISVGVSYLTNKAIVVRTWNDKLDYWNSEAISRRRFSTYVAASYRSKYYGFHGLDLRWHSASIADSVLHFNPEYVLNGKTRQQYLQFTYTYNYDKRDIRQYPLRGSYTLFQASKRGLLPSDDINQFYLLTQYRKYIPINKKIYFNTSLKGRLLFPQRQPYLTMTGLGYRFDLVRGYELNVIDGSHYAIAQNELKYQFFSTQKSIKWLPRQFGTIPLALYLNSFADVGYIKNNYSDWNRSQLANKPLVGGGVGLDFVTFYNMVYRLSYSLNNEGQNRIFFALKGEF